MTNNVYKFRVSLVVACTLLLTACYAQAVLAQEVSDNEESNTASSTATTTDVSVGVPDVVDYADHPYQVEDLIGDKVFNDFVLGPGKVELAIEPGQSRTVELNVTNRYAETKRFSFEVEDMIGTNNPDKPVALLGGDRGPYSMMDYVDIPMVEFDLVANKRVVVPVTITVPPDAEPGGYYGSVLVKTVTVEAEKGSTGTAPRPAIVSRIGTLFFVTVPGDVETEGELVNFSTVGNQTIYQEGPVNFQIVYENRGSIHLNPYGELTITNMFGDEVGYVELEPWFTMPKSLRTREVSWGRDFLYGKYTANLKLNRGYDNQIDEMEFTFWVIPWKLVAIIFGAFFVFFFILRFFSRNFEFKRRN